MTDAPKLDIVPNTEENKEPLITKENEAKPEEKQADPIKLVTEEPEKKPENAGFKDDTAKSRTRVITTTIRDTWWRFLFLGLCCTILFGSYYCYDNPAPVEKKIKAPVKYRTDKGDETGMAMSDVQYQLLYSLYSFPNIIIPLFGGYFIDRLGKRKGIVIFASIVAVGQFFFAVSAHAVRSSTGFGQFLALMGRFVFGLGGENLSVTESAFVATWFKGKELSLALGVDLCVSRLFAAINDATQPAFYDAAGFKLTLGFWFGFILCLISLACALGLVVLDNKADQSCVQIEVPVTENQGVTDIEEKEEEEEVEETIQITDLKKFPLPFWLLTGSCVMTYMSFYSFMNISSDLLQTRFSFSLESAGWTMGLPYVIAAIVTPFLGYAVDLYGLKTLASIFFSSGNME